MLERVKFHWLTEDAVKSQFVVEEANYVRDVDQTADFSSWIYIFMNAIWCFLLLEQSIWRFFGASATWIVKIR